MLFTASEYFPMNMAEYDTYLFYFIDTDDLVCHNQGITSHRAEYAPMPFQMLMGWALHHMIYFRKNKNWYKNNKQTKIVCSKNVHNFITLFIG